MIDGPHATDRRRALLVAALGFCCCSGERCRGDREAGSNRGWPETDASRLRTPDPETPLTILRGWLSSWRGIGLVAAFYVTGREHSPTGATGSAFEATPFRAVQVAAWETLTRT